MRFSPPKKSAETHVNHIYILELVSAIEPLSVYVQKKNFFLIQEVQDTEYIDLKRNKLTWLGSLIYIDFGTSVLKVMQIIIME